MINFSVAFFQLHIFMVNSSNYHCDCVSGYNTNAYSTKLPLRLMEILHAVVCRIVSS